MHLGQTATFFAEVFNRPEPTVRMVARLLRQGGWVRTGPRGVNAPHLNADELATFILAVMCSPDSPAIGIDRLAHFRGLLLERDDGSTATFADGVARLLDRLATSDAQHARVKHWRIRLFVDMSRAVISEDFEDDDGTLEHHFTSLVNVSDATPLRTAFPYYSGLEVQTGLQWLTLFRIAKVALANEADPLPEVAKMLSQQQG